jgi:hypothetical protein
MLWQQLSTFWSSPQCQIPHTTCEPVACMRLSMPPPWPLPALQVAALEVEQIVKRLSANGDTRAVWSLVDRLISEFAFSQQANHRKVSSPCSARCGPCSTLLRCPSRPLVLCRANVPRNSSAVLSPLLSLYCLISLRELFYASPRQQWALGNPMRRT